MKESKPYRFVNATHSGASVIVLDSSETSRDIAEAVLNMCGYQSIKAPTWSAALPHVAKAQAIILDVNLPQISGEMVAEILSKNFPQIRLYVFNNDLDESSHDVARKLGAAGILKGRCRPDVLLAEVRALDLWI